MDKHKVSNDDKRKQCMGLNFIHPSVTHEHFDFQFPNQSNHRPTQM